MLGIARNYRQPVFFGSCSNEQVGTIMIEFGRQGSPLPGDARCNVQYAVCEVTLQRLQPTKQLLRKFRVCRTLFLGAALDVLRRSDSMYSAALRQRFSSNCHGVEQLLGSKHIAFTDEIQKGPQRIARNRIQVNYKV